MCSPMTSSFAILVFFLARRYKKLMTCRETLRAKMRSKKSSQNAVDKLIAYDKELENNPTAEVPNLEDGIFGGIFSSRQTGSGKIYVWLDNMNLGNSDKKVFYYVRYYNLILDYIWGGVSTAYGHPALIVQKDKLRLDQIEYMERKCKETRESKDLIITW